VVPVSCGVGRLGSAQSSLSDPDVARRNRHLVMDTVMINDHERLRKLIEEKCLLTDGDFTLSTGARSSFYFDCKNATLDGECLALIAAEVLQHIDTLPVRPSAVGGLTLGADFIVAAVVMKAHELGHPTIHGSIVRKEPKKHGTKNMIENELPAGTKIVVVDDVITSGKSTQKACDEFGKAGHEIVGVIALVDREAGGTEALARRYQHVRSIFRKTDFPKLVAMERHDAERARTNVAV
jgi:orotate phosphoribosyltransferase